MTAGSSGQFQPLQSDCEFSISRAWLPRKRIVRRSVLANRTPTFCWSCCHEIALDGHVVICCHARGGRRSEGRERRSSEEGVQSNVPSFRQACGRKSCRRSKEW